jgi:hypothetical protein
VRQERSQQPFEPGPVIGLDPDRGIDRYDLGVESIRPDRFRITSAGEGREWELQPRVLLFFRVLELRSEAQPEVLKLICQKSDNPLSGRNPSVPQMQEALGSYVTFEFAGSPQQAR